MPKRPLRRRMHLEKMECRIALAADAGHNFLLPTDVNNDNAVAPSDALVIINRIARGDAGGSGEAVSSDLSAGSADQGIRELYYDVNDDQNVTPHDALMVINQVARSVGVDDASEIVETTSGVRTRIELEVHRNGEAEFQVRIVGAAANESYDVSVDGEVLGQIETDENGRGKLKLKYAPDRADVPAVLASATATTPFAIGDIVSGTLGSVGELESHDSGHDDSNEDESEDDSDDDSSDDSNGDHSSSSSDDSSDDDEDSDDDSTSDSGDDSSDDGSPSGNATGVIAPVADTSDSGSSDDSQHPDDDDRLDDHSSDNGSKVGADDDSDSDEDQNDSHDDHDDSEDEDDDNDDDEDHRHSDDDFDD